MSVMESKTVDAVALTNDKKGIALLITDHMDWENEYQHLLMLQEKINTYIDYFEEKQYKKPYKKEHIKYGIIEIHFLYELPLSAKKFLQVAQEQIKGIGLKIQYSISQGV